MLNIIFITSLACALGIVYYWAFQHLPLERWQILGVIPIRKQPDGQWHGLNLTYYGLITAGAVTFALAITLILMASVGVAMPTMMLLVSGLLILSALCAKWVARWVEKKLNTFTIGGAAFCGLVGSPILLFSLQPVISRFGLRPLPLMAFITAMAIGYTFGEGIGRLACLSFGCCYGKPIDRLPPLLRRLTGSLCIVFQGDTKKAAYADGFTGCKLFPVQAITVILYTIAGLTGTYLYLEGMHKGAYLTCVLVTQIWRVLSEFLRADYRGGGRISTYQYLAGIAAMAAVIYSFALPEMPITADLRQGLQVFWNPVTILICQFFWLGIFLYTGRSQVTAARLTLFVRSDQT